MALIFGNDTGKDFMKSMQRQLVTTLMINPIPQTALPIVENVTNYSFFTGRPIVGQGLENVAPQYQIGPTTSHLAQKIGAELGISPMKIDHLINGYTGTMGMYAVSALDNIFSANNYATDASKRISQMPFIKRFAMDPYARGTVTSYYELKNATDQAVRTSLLLERTGNFKEQGEFMKDNIKMLANKQYILDLEKTMKQMRETQRMIQMSKMDPDAKRSALDNITKAQNNITANVQQLKKMID
jgi:hypothetical protein